MLLFKNFTGTKLENYNGTVFYVKRPESGSAKIKISNKYAITIFRAVYDGNFGTAIKLNDDTLRYSVDTTVINLNMGEDTIIHPEDCLSKLIKLQEFEWRAFNGSFVLNTLAENQIANGRDYANYPSMKVYVNIHKNKYFDGTELRAVPSRITYIVFKAGGYELHQDAIDGTLLYDSLA